jgi:succinate dehydrogenase / fumarate reductase membrane anchor subunit
VVKKTVSGLRAWLLQRFTAVYLLAFFLFALLHLSFAPPESYQAWRSWITGAPIRQATALFFVSLFLHVWVGLRDVAMDYVQSLPLRVAVLALLAFVLTGLGIWTLQMLWSA